MKGSGEAAFNLSGVLTNAEAAAKAARVSEAENYAYQTLDYIYRRLKAPSSMEVLVVRAGPYDHYDHYQSVPEIMKPSGAILSLTDDYNVVTMQVKAMNSFGAMVTDTYVALFDLTTGQIYHDLEGYASDRANDAWGARKLEWMDDGCRERGPADSDHRSAQRGRQL